MRDISLIDEGRQDLRFALRQLLTHRAFTATALLVLTLGIGGSVTMFGFVDAALIKPLPYQEPSRLVTIFSTKPDLAPLQTRGPASYLDVVDWRTRAYTVASIAAYDVRGGFTVMTASGPERVTGLRVTSGFFRTLGVTPILGRDFLPTEEGPGGTPAVVLSHAAWQRRFGGRPDVLGQTITLQSPWLASAEPHVVVGVLPKDFHFTMAGHAELWATIRGAQACWDVRSCRSLEAIARLAPGVSSATATAHLTSVVEQLHKEYPSDYRHDEVAKLFPLRNAMLGNVQPILLMLLGGAGLLLVIACINVVSLLLARAESRRREMAVRRALGASRARLARQFATEAVALTVVTAIGGLVFATWAIPFLTSLLTADMISRMPYLQSVGLSPRAIVFACAIALVVGAVFAITPIVRTSIATSSEHVAEGSRGASGVHWRRFGAPLVVAELAVAVVLLVSAGLLGKSLYRLLHVDTGFNVQDLLSIGVTPVSTRARDASGTSDRALRQPGELARRVAERVSALPGIESVGYADLLPLASGLAPASTFWVIGRAEADQRQESCPVRRVSASYFNALEARLVRGRAFTEQEVSGVKPVMIINDTAARRYFAGDDPIGRSVAFGGPASPAREIVGVVADIADGPPETPAHASAYVPFDQSGFALVVRTPIAGSGLTTLLRATIREVDPETLLGDVTPMAERIHRMPSTTLQRASAWLLGGFASTAFVLSVIGLYGVVAYSVGQRTREIGVRMALGAPRESVYRLVMGDASRLVAMGAVLGVVCAIGAATLMRHLLFGVEPWDPMMLTVAAATLTVSALAASYLPARRAASVNPIEVLRSE
jgi:macrolide transport system ATP-binding/permease protein